jgi:NitT/TauT family transport system permease protein
MNVFSHIPSRTRWFIGVVVVLLIIWEGTVKLFHVPNFLFPSIEDVVGELIKSPRFYLRNAGFTLATTVAGFLIATGLGVAIAIAIVASRVLENIFLTLLALIHSLPKVALAPLVAIWLGTGATPKIIIAVLTAIFTIVIDTVVGMQSVDPEMVNMARVKRASHLHIFAKIRFPHALPNLFGALKAAAAFALVGALVGEFVGGQLGLGYVILVAQGNFDTPRAFAAVLLLGIEGTLLYYILVFLESRLLPWHISQRILNSSP